MESNLDFFNDLQAVSAELQKNLRLLEKEVWSMKWEQLLEIDTSDAAKQLDSENIVKSHSKGISILLEVLKQHTQISEKLEKFHQVQESDLAMLVEEFNTYKQILSWQEKEQALLEKFLLRYNLINPEQAVADDAVSIVDELEQIVGELEQNVGELEQNVGELEQNVGELEQNAPTAPVESTATLSAKKKERTKKKVRFNLSEEEEKKIQEKEKKIEEKKVKKKPWGQKIDRDDWVKMAKWLEMTRPKKKEVKKKPWGQKVNRDRVKLWEKKNGVKEVKEEEKNEEKRMEPLEKKNEKEEEKNEEKSVEHLEKKNEKEEKEDEKKEEESDDEAGFRLFD